MDTTESVATELAWHTRERHITHEQMNAWLPNYQKRFDRARMIVSPDIDQPDNPVDRLYNIEVSDKRLDARAAKHAALATEGWQFAGTQSEAQYEQNRRIIQEKYGDHLAIPAHNGISGEPRPGHVEIFAQQQVLDRALSDAVSELDMRRLAKRYSQILEDMEESRDEDEDPPTPDPSPTNSPLRLVE